jgi:hypothetical protein
MNVHTYVGGELGLFSQAHHWKAYWISQLRRYIGGSILEVGAGIGANTVILRNGHERRWLCLEPDSSLASQLEETIAGCPACRGTEVRAVTLADVDETEKFDTILYIDVLEHIESDSEELEHAAKHLNPNGRVVALSPAHGWLFSEFDKSIGHCRRYTARSIEDITPSKLCVERSFYLDSVGLIASAANRFLLRQSMPNARQIRVWDDVMVPCSRLLDPLVGRRLGKSVVCVWRRNS